MRSAPEHSLLDRDVVAVTPGVIEPQGCDHRHCQRRDEFGAPVPVFPVSWQDTGSGVFTIALAAVVLGFGPGRAEPARRVGLLAILAGAGALLVTSTCTKDRRVHG